MLLPLWYLRCIPFVDIQKREADSLDDSSSGDSCGPLQDKQRQMVFNSIEKPVITNNQYGSTLTRSTFETETADSPVAFAPA